MNSGWQAGLTTLNNVPAATREQADAVAASIGWVVEQDEDSANGIWLVAIPDNDLVRLMTEGDISITGKAGWGNIEADIDQIGPLSCPRCGATHFEDPSCGKTIHSSLPHRS